MSSYFKLLKSFQGDILFPAFSDFLRSLPDSLMIGTGIFALLTQSFPLGILVLAISEIAIINRIFAGFFTTIGGDNQKVGIDACTPGLPSPYQISILGSLLSQSTFPSGPVFLVSGVIMYILSSTQNFSEELKELGKKDSEWNLRLPMSYVFSLLLLLVFSFWRFTNNCDDVMTILGSILFGIVIGFLIYLLHVYLFGRDSINFLGIPLLADRSVTGRPLYACAKQSK